MADRRQRSGDNTSGSAVESKTIAERFSELRQASLKGEVSEEQLSVDLAAVASDAVETITAADPGEDIGEIFSAARQVALIGAEVPEDSVLGQRLAQIPDIRAKTDPGPEPASILEAMRTNALLGLGDEDTGVIPGSMLDKRIQELGGLENIGIAAAALTPPTGIDASMPGMTTPDPGQDASGGDSTGRQGGWEGDGGVNDLFGGIGGGDLVGDGGDSDTATTPGVLADTLPAAGSGVGSATDVFPGGGTGDADSPGYDDGGLADFLNDDSNWTGSSGGSGATSAGGSGGGDYPAATDVEQGFETTAGGGTRGYTTVSYDDGSSETLYDDGTATKTSTDGTTTEVAPEDTLAYQAWQAQQEGEGDSSAGSDDGSDGDEQADGAATEESTDAAGFIAGDDGTGGAQGLIGEVESGLSSSMVDFWGNRTPSGDPTTGSDEPTPTGDGSDAGGTLRDRLGGGGTTDPTGGDDGGAAGLFTVTTSPRLFNRAGPEVDPLTSDGVDLDNPTLNPDFGTSPLSSDVDDEFDAGTDSFEGADIDGG